MFTTGNSFTDSLLLLNCFLPLIPAALIFFRRNEEKESLNLLLIICVLRFIEGLLKASSSLDFESQYITNNVFSLLELVLFTQLFKPLLSPTSRNTLNILLAALVSVLLTWFCLKGWGLDYPALDTLQNALLIGMISCTLPSLIRTTGLHIFQSPLFWIAGGTLFYLLIFTLLEWVGPCCLPAPRSLPPEKMLFLAIAGLIQYILYILATLVSRPAEEPE